jgi:hypothetical protein
MKEKTVCHTVGCKWFNVQKGISPDNCMHKKYVGKDAKDDGLQGAIRKATDEGYKRGWDDATWFVSQK